jgi:hypothetical protein
MVTVNESASSLKQGNSDSAALRVISLDQVIPFTQYIRYVLPLDGYVFWMRTQTIQVRGSLHMSILKRQNEDETFANNTVIFTTADMIQSFNEISPNKIWVGEFEDQKFAFTRSDGIYKAAGIFHYTGDAVNAAMLSQLIDVGDQLPASTLIVSNSLPLWLSLVTYTPVWLVPNNPLITLYPSFAIPDNLRPPYGAVHVEPGATRILQATPLLGPTHPVGNAALGTYSGTALSATHWQLVSDHVRVTLYGATNQVAMDFMELVNAYSYDQDVMGIMSATPMRDEKRVQTELGILAMKKTIEFDVSYYQTRVDDVARQLIEHVTAIIIPRNLGA